MCASGTGFILRISRFLRLVDFNRSRVPAERRASGTPIRLQYSVHRFACNGQRGSYQHGHAPVATKVYASAEHSAPYASQSIRATQVPTFQRPRRSDPRLQSSRPCSDPPSTRRILRALPLRLLLRGLGPVATLRLALTCSIQCGARLVRCVWRVQTAMLREA